MTNSFSIETKALSKTFPSPGGNLTILRGIDFSLHPGETAAVIGPSGSGKTTFLSLCAGLDNPTSGEVSLFGQPLSGLSESERARFRNKNAGFVFQTFRLIPSLTALENVKLPAEIQGNPDADRLAREALGRVGLSSREGHLPSQLSGGEQQRVGLARAFITSPGILFADEPTGNLDPASAETIADLLFDLNRENKTTLLLITHDAALASRAERSFRMTDGVLEPASR